MAIHSFGGCSMPRRTGDKYSAILDAAIAVIAEHGYHNAQISRIARRANVADGTIYLYFKSKQDLLVCLFREKLGQLVAEARDRLGRLADPREKLRALVAGHFQVMTADRSFATVTQIELRQPDREMREPLLAAMRPYLELVDEVIRSGQEQGLFKTHLDLRQMRNMVFGTLDQTVTAWVMTGFGFDLEAQAEPTFELLISGLETREG